MAQDLLFQTAGQNQDQYRIAGFKNLGLNAVGSANTLIVTLKNASGGTPSTLDPVEITYCANNSLTPVPLVRTQAAALSITLAGATTLGIASNVETPVYVYLIDNAGTNLIGVSLSLFDEGTLQSTSVTTTSNAVLYSSSAVSSKAIRLIGRILATNIGGAWQVTTEVSIAPFLTAGPAMHYYTATGTFDTNQNLVTYTTKVIDTHNAYASGIFTAPQAGKYMVSAQLRANGTFSDGDSCTVTIQKSNVDYANRTQWASSNTEISVSVSAIVSMVVGDTIKITSQETGIATPSFTSGIGGFVSIAWIGR